jgi:hypothetical protein
MTAMMGINSKDVFAFILSFLHMKEQLMGNNSLVLFVFLLFSVICWLVDLVSRVGKGWKRMIDHHAMLLNNLDFSDPLLQKKVTTTLVCNLIYRSGKRLRHISIWNHYYPNSALHSKWVLDDIITTISLIGPSLSLQSIVLFGHQGCSQQGGSHVNIDAIVALRPHLIELATCGCRSATLFDNAAKASSTSISRRSSSGNGNNGENVRKVEFRSRVAQYGLFQCTSLPENCLLAKTIHGYNVAPTVTATVAAVGPTSDATQMEGWYRACITCKDHYCVACAFRWRWCNEFLVTLTNVSDDTSSCPCSYCTPRHRLLFSPQSNNHGGSSSLTPMATLLPRYCCTLHCAKCSRK